MTPISRTTLLVDGNPIGIGHKAGYPPNQDAIQESVVSQNSVDAESGHSAGGIISLTTKGGTNEWHGNAFYLGRYPWLSAEADRTRFTQKRTATEYVRRHVGKSDLEKQALQFLLDGVLESGCAGQLLSDSADGSGAARRFFDRLSRPMVPCARFTIRTTTLVNGSTVTRTPFVGNKIPSSQFDPLSASLLSSFFGGKTFRASATITPITTSTVISTVTTTTTCQTGLTIT